MSSDDNGEKTYVNPFGTATIHEDGSLTADHVAAKVETDGDGQTRINLKKLTRIAINNIVDIECHTIKRDETATSHHLIFRGGGEVRLSYRPDGKLLEFSGRGITINISKEGVLTLGIQPIE